MTHTHSFPTSVRLLEYGTLTVVAELHDPVNGVLVGAEIEPPQPNKRQARIKSARSGGSYGVGSRLPDDGTIVVPITIEGASWAEQQSRQKALYDALDGLDRFYVEVVLSGVTTRWFSDAPVDVFPDPIDAAARMNNELGYELRFLVQPNPSVTIA